MHRKDEAIPIEYAREIAAGIPSARIVELQGIDHWPTVGDIKSITGEVEEFLTGQRHEHLPDRLLATVLFTDIVDSTRHAARLGDRGWRELLARHDDVTHTEISRFQGRVIQHTGDGFSRRSTARRAPFGVRPRSRSGCRVWVSMCDVVCTGECEIRGEDIGGIAVHIGARVAALAQAGEVLVSSTVKDLVNGSGIAFQERGTHMLKGVPGQWQLFAPAGQLVPVDHHIPVKRRGFQAFMADRISRRPRVARTVLRLSHRR
ncbi:MAG TPA: adenylate/guanylate cyclase domain-containing protein [Mycobacterium sp.]|nr:adenylate/guanylate cyclase domain-containing protein [Mycobacterium sp.]